MGLDPYRFAKTPSPEKVTSVIDIERRSHCQKRVSQIWMPSSRQLEKSSVPFRDRRSSLLQPWMEEKSEGWLGEIFCTSCIT